MSLLGFAKRQADRAAGLVESALIEAENTARVTGVLPPRPKRRTRKVREAESRCPGVYYRDGDGKVVGPVVRCCLGEPEGDEGLPGAHVWVDGGSIQFDPDRMEQAQVYIVELNGKAYGLRRSGHVVDVLDGG
jgi:hypothetical protein